jgi:uncharacterized protein (TIRG00374 family)
MTSPSARAAATPDIGRPPADGGNRPPPRRRRALRVVLFVAGLAAAAALLALVGWSSIAANLDRIDGTFALLVALYALAQIAFAAGWWILVAPPQPISFGELFAAYLAGDSVNYVTGVGGDPVKAHLLSPRMGFGPAFATVAVHRHADVVAQWLFLAAGAAIALNHFALPPVVRILVLAGLLVLGALVLGFTRALRGGIFGPLLRRLSGFQPLAGRLRRLEDQARELDERVRRYYHGDTHRGRFAAAVAWGVLGWCGGLLETYIVLRLLSPGHGLPSAIAIETLSMILNSILIFIPAKIGSAEGVRVGVATLVGLTSAQGAAYALVRRARELLWLAPGIVLLLKRHILGVGVGGMRLEPVALDPNGKAS